MLGLQLSASNKLHLPQDDDDDDAVFLQELKNKQTGFFLFPFCLLLFIMHFFAKMIEKFIVPAFLFFWVGSVCGGITFENALISGVYIQANTFEMLMKKNGELGAFPSAGLEQINSSTA